MDPYADEYMAQEDEWEREGLLDPEWEKQQRKVSKGKILTSFFSLLDQTELLSLGFTLNVTSCQ